MTSRRQKQILAGDVGGTNVRFCLVRAGRGGLKPSGIWKRPGDDFPSFESALAEFLKEAEGEGGAAAGAEIAGASLGVAGPVAGGRARLTHRAWTIDAEAVSGLIGGGPVLVVNDFEAMARSAPGLEAADLLALKAGDADATGNIAVAGPGTGLGVAVLRRLRRDGGRDGGWTVVGGEGGHQAFAPQTELEWRVAEHLRAEGVYVSNEVICSGSGHAETLRAISRVMGADAPDWSAADADAAAHAGDALALALQRLRARTVMTVLGNAVLAASATGGAFVAGGIGVRLAPWLSEADALARFQERGPHAGMMRRTPIQIITGAAAPLLGTAQLWADWQGRGWR